ncbi:MAG: ChaN family lipoprotein [Planctomycetota bacterium]
MALAALAVLALPGCRFHAASWNDPADLAAYRAAFAASAGTRFVATSTRAELLDRLAAVRVLWLGDHHTSRSLHALHRQLLDELGSRPVRPLLVLEAIGDADEPAVADYLAERCDEATLRQRLLARWPGSWLDDPDLDPRHYRALLERARAHDWPVRALEPVPRASLADRDPAIGDRVRALAARHPDRLLVVVVGQAHLVGGGDVIARSGLPSIAFGGEPTPDLVAAAPDRGAPNRLLASDGGLWWFAELLAPSP